MADKHPKSWTSKSTASKGLTTKPSRSAFTTTARSTHAASTSRPSTAASRPTTSAVKSKGLNTIVEREWVAAVIERKGIGREVGIASCDLSSGRCVLTQLADSQTFFKTCHSLTQRNPGTILLPQSSFETSRYAHAENPAGMTRTGRLVECLSDIFEEANIIGVVRSYWSDQAGLEFIEQLVLDDDQKAVTLNAVQSKFYVLAATSALFKHLEVAHQVIFPIHSLRIEYVALEGTMLIDPETTANLELVTNLLDRNSKHCLFGLLNQCYTPMGSRLLRMNILGPLVDVDAISARLDVVEELLNSEDRMTTLQKALSGIGSYDYDKLVGSVISTEPQGLDSVANPKLAIQAAEHKISYLLQLRIFIRALPPLRAALEGSTSDLLNKIHALVSDDSPTGILERINLTINEEAVRALKNGQKVARSAKLYAVRAQENQLLDVARLTYEENCSDAETLAQTLSEEHGFDIGLKQTDRGFVFFISNDVVQKNDLPKTFTNQARKGKLLHFTTLEQAKLNGRIQNSMDEIYLLSDRILDDVFGDIRSHIASLFRSVEGIALLDMLVSFTKTASMQNYIRPEYQNTLAIAAGRHPIHERFNYIQQGAFVPNDTFASPMTSFQLITGPNLSGKSTFIRQNALLVVMAQIGSFVPADYASFIIHDALFSRLSNDDNILAGLSTFAKEMRTMSGILAALSSFSNPLVIVDELGRGTSLEEGVGIAHAIAEEIIKSKAVCFFTTHYRDLTITLPKLYPNVALLELKSEVNVDGHGSRIIHHHRVADGATQVKHYGLKMAEMVSLPEDMMVTARRVASKIDKLEEAGQRAALGNVLAQRRRYLLQLKGKLEMIANGPPLEDEPLREYLVQLQREAIQTLSALMPSTASTRRFDTDADVAMSESETEHNSTVLPDSKVVEPTERDATELSDSKFAEPTERTSTGLPDSNFAEPTERELSS